MDPPYCSASTCLKYLLVKIDEVSIITEQGPKEECFMKCNNSRAGNGCILYFVFCFVAALILWGAIEIFGPPIRYIVTKLDSMKHRTPVELALKSIVDEFRKFEPVGWNDLQQTQVTDSATGMDYSFYMFRANFNTPRNGDMGTFAMFSSFNGYDAAQQMAIETGENTNIIFRTYVFCEKGNNNLFLAEISYTKGPGEISEFDYELKTEKETGLPKMVFPVLLGFETSTRVKALRIFEFPKKFRTS